MGLVCLKNRQYLADECHVAECFTDRFFGWMGRAHAPERGALLLPRCKSIHMWFMRFEIDVVFLKRTDGGSGSSSWRVLEVHAGVRPWKVMPLICLSADDVIELPSGTLAKAQVNPGDEICIG